jgi:hypothetical protein
MTVCLVIMLQYVKHPERALKTMDSVPSKNLSAHLQASSLYETFRSRSGDQVGGARQKEEILSLHEERRMESGAAAFLHSLCSSVMRRKDVRARGDSSESGSNA